VAAHAFEVRRGSRNLAQAEWRIVNDELRSWFPECRLQIQMNGEMGPFGVRVAGRITVTLLDGPESRAAAASLLERALHAVGRPDLLELEAERGD
jgi:hypothetical protein